MKLIRDFLESLVIVILVISGIGGMLYHLFRQAGWGSVLLDKIFTLYLLHPFWMIPLTVLAIFAGTVWHDYRVAKGTYNKKLPTYFLYALMAAGVYFIGHYAIRGTL